MSYCFCLNVLKTRIANTFFVQHKEIKRTKENNIRIALKGKLFQCISIVKTVS